MIKSIYTHKTKGKNITVKFIHDQKKIVAEKWILVFGFRARARWEMLVGAKQNYEVLPPYPKLPRFSSFFLFVSVDF